MLSVLRCIIWCVCSYYVIVAWIWSIIWYLGLDPIKWVMMWILNEDGWRDHAAFKKQKQVCWKPLPRPIFLPPFPRCHSQSRFLLYGSLLPQLSGSLLEWASMYQHACAALWPAHRIVYLYACAL